MFFAKLMTAVLVLVLAFAVVLGLRQQRLELMHEMSVLHQQMDADRKETWDLQTDIAARTQPQKLRDAAERVGLEFEPLTTPEDTADSRRVAEAAR